MPKKTAKRKQKTKRRGNGEGSVYPLPNGKWRVTVSTRINGRWYRISRIRDKHADCLALLPKLRAQIGGGSTMTVTTLAEYLREWLKMMTSDLEPQTIESYQYSINEHVIPRLGNIRLGKLTALHCEQFKAAMIADGVKPRAAQYAFQNLRNALKRAVYPLRLIPSNPCDGLKTPKHTKRKMEPFESHEMRKIIKSSENTRWHALYAVAFGCGLRAAELLGLRWSEVDTRNQKLSVTMQAITRGGNARLAKPKTKSSIRTVDIPATVVDALRQHRVLQMTEGLAGCDLVFPTLHGKILGYANFYKDEWQKRLKTCELSKRGFHNCRHTFATLSLLAGVPLAVVSKALGHANPAITLAIYAHCLPSAENAAAKAMQQLLASG